MKIKALGFVSAAEAPSGSLIAYPDGTVVLVSEYSTAKDGNFCRDCYITNSGERFWGDFDAKGMLIEIDTDYPVEEEMGF